MSIPAVWDVLVRRELIRMSLSRTSEPKSPQEIFYAITESKLNRRANRYSNVFAYDRTAVKVDGQYLNANVVKDREGAWWVAAQAPLPSTFDLFFRAIETQAASRHPLIQAETNGAVIVQLTGDEEGGMRKADPYLVTRHIDHREERSDIASIVTDFRVAGVPVRHYQFSAWPDFGVPTGEAVTALGRLVSEVDAVGRGNEVWVHCSAGVGRSGTFLALASLLRRGGLASSYDVSPIGPLPPELESDPVATTVDAMRDWRGALIQTQEQLELVYKLTATQQ